MRRFHTKLFFLLVLGVLLSIMPVSAQDDNILRIVALSDIRTVDPHVAYEIDTWPATSLFHVGLVKQDINGDPVPALAESWVASDDGTSFTFTLREGIKFSNGRDITTEDVKYSFERLLNPETAAPTAFMFTVIEGTEAFQSGEADEVSGIQIIDERTIQFTLSRAEWTMMKRFALVPAFIVPREGVEAAEIFGREPLGAGPFILESWESGVRMMGTRNPNYYEEGKPFVDGFEITIGVEPSVGVLRMEAGEADVSLDQLISADYARLVADAALSPRLLPLAAFPNVDYIILNTNMEPFTELAVRQALNMAVDRERLVQLTSGRAGVANGFIPTGVVGDNTELQPAAYDPEAARALLAEAGYADGFTTQIVTNTDPEMIARTQAVISDWAAIGVQVEITSLDNAQFLDVIINQGQEWPMISTEWYMDYVDPSNNYEPLIHCGVGDNWSYNWVHHCSEESDVMFREAAQTPPGDDRWAAFAALEAQVQDVMPNIWLQHRRIYYFTSERLTIESNPAILFVFADATVQ
jgi:ABC-type transport system substrate-binding protein